MKSTQTARVTINHDVTVGDLIKWLETMPTQGKISLHHTSGDRPFDPDEDSLSVTWTGGN